MAKQTKQQRIKALVDEGMSHVEAEIVVVRREAEEKITALKEKQEKEEAKVRETILELLQKEQPDTFESLRKKAKKKLSDDARERRTRAQSGSAESKPLPPMPNPGQTGSAPQR